ncbi:methylated-DNA--[protein]-cysteine S-methyltransferase [Sporosarcina ureae]|uniref:methylated-DNA--[protein]-cysteine S-methyltransferase n=1 Tax=Sporosarcina ureae TaxID=1571 RepID=UPI0034E961A8
MNVLVYWTQFKLKEWLVTLAATEKGLCYVGMADDSVERLKDWLKRSDTEELMEDETKLTVYISKLKEYFSGTITNFPTVSLDLKGTLFQQQVWQALQQIPYGETRTYSNIAEHIGNVSSVRAVASAIGKNPVLIVVPCHRVIAKDGSLSGYRDGKDCKQSLLQLEKKSWVSDRTE